MFFINYYRTLIRDLELVASLRAALRADGEANDWVVNTWGLRNSVSRHTFVSDRLGIKFVFTDDDDLIVQRPCEVTVPRWRAARLFKDVRLLLLDDAFSDLDDDEPRTRRRRAAFLARLANGEFATHTTVEASVDMLVLRRALRALKGETFVIRRTDEINRTKVLYHIYFGDANEGVMFKLGN